jgi:5-methylcytosine-specific restriction endonuclease McrA
MPNRPPVHRPFRPSTTKRQHKRADPYYTSAHWRRLRALVLERDQGICQRCGRPGADTVHHIIERSHGGSDDPRNLEAVHRHCHNRVHPDKGGNHDG